jgi:hypothetical protein
MSLRCKSISISVPIGDGGNPSPSGEVRFRVTSLRAPSTGLESTLFQAACDDVHDVEFVVVPGSMGPVELRLA